MEELLVILNPHAGSAGDAAAVVEDHASANGWTLARTEREGHGRELAEDAAERGVARVVAAGGDGTVTEVLDGLMRGGGSSALGVIPLGTGNDLARNLRVPLDPRRACEHLASEPPVRAVDVIEVHSERGHAFCVNSLNGGLGNAVRERLDPQLKKTWGPLAFTLAALRAATELRSWDVRLTLDGRSHPLANVVSVIVANAPAAAGGVEIAPAADMADAQLDALVVSGTELADLAELAVRAKSPARFDESPLVQHAHGREVRLEVPEGFRFSLDGEPFEGTDVRCRVLGGALRVISGE